MAADQKTKNNLRRDAQLRRERLVRAAVELYASDGFDIPLEKIADRAAVGRATLYRNFPDRAALSAAVLQVHVDRLAAQVEKWSDRDDAFFLGLRALAKLTLASSGLEKIAPMSHQAPSITKAFKKGVEKILSGPLARAKAAGLIREDFDLSDIHMAALMIAGGGLDSRERNAARNIERALRLLSQGLAPSSPSKRI
jgi:AcrR family transcriptional regulator